MKVIAIIFIILSAIGIINDLCYARYLAKNDSNKYKEIEMGLIIQTILKGFFLIGFSLIIKMS